MKNLSSLGRVYRSFQYYTRNVPIFLTESRGPYDYFIWSDCLFGISIDHPSPAIRFDENAILMFDYGGEIGVRYNPAYIGWWGLLNLRKHFLSGERRFIDNFKSQVDWLLRNQSDRMRKAPVWTYDFDWWEGKTFLKAPWISSMSQGLGMSCLVRAYRLESEERFLEVAREASRVFEWKIEDGGIQTVEHGKVFYEEYPAVPLVRILDGFIFGLLGLYDLYEETRDSRVKQLFDEGVEGIESYLEKWNHRNIWSWYGTHGFLSPPEYNKLNSVLLQALSLITGNPLFEQFGRAWDNGQKNTYGKIKTLYFLFKRSRD